MYNQNWHVVYGPLKTAADIAPDTQITDAIEMTWRMAGELGEPGPEITVYVFGEYSDPNGQRNDGTWPPAVVTTQVGYSIREDNDYTDYEYTRSDMTYPATEDGKNVALFSAVKHQGEWLARLGDANWDWNGKDPMNRSGGPV